MKKNSFDKFNLCKWEAATNQFTFTTCILWSDCVIVSILVERWARNEPNRNMTSLRNIFHLISWGWGLISSVILLLLDAFVDSGGQQCWIPKYKQTERFLLLDFLKVFSFVLITVGSLFCLIRIKLEEKFVDEDEEKKGFIHEEKKGFIREEQKIKNPVIRFLIVFSLISSFCWLGSVVNRIYETFHPGQVLEFFAIWKNNLEILLGFFGAVSFHIFLFRINNKKIEN